MEPRRLAKTPRPAAAQVLTVTPAMAREWLASSGQRYVDMGKVRFYTALFAAGAWKPGDEVSAIVLSSGNRLTDGNHRLCAVVRFGHPVDLLVKQTEPRTGNEFAKRTGKGVAQ